MDFIYDVVPCVSISFIWFNLFNGAGEVLVSVVYKFREEDQSSILGKSKGFFS
jgi:hypothetical protein